LSRVDAHSPYRSRGAFGSVQVIKRLPDAHYDDLLSESVVFLELFDTSANNAVVECIVRCTPIVINRHPAVVEYLGPDYPLYYDTIAEVENLLTRDSIMSAYEYLCQYDKEALSGSLFRDRVELFVSQRMK
jgi:hypothetical protein